MIIGYDAKRIVRNRTGLGSYGRTLVGDLADAVGPGTELRLYAPDKGDDTLRRRVEGRPNVSFAYPAHAVGALGKALWRSRGIVADLEADGVGLYHGLSGELPRGIRRAGIRTVVTMHDVIFLRHPEWYPWPDRQLYARKFRATCAEADRIIAISQCTKRDVMSYGGVPEEKIDVICQSCGLRYKARESRDKLREVRTRYGLPARYVVSVGTIEERKNVLLAVKALPLLPGDVSLVVVGRPTKYCAKVKLYAVRNGLAGRVTFLHGVPDCDLPALYQMAEACVYPSRYEGFGLPVVEAIQSGLPVVACTGSCLEEAGGDGALYVDPDDPQAMAEALRQSLKGAPGRDGRIRAGMEYVRRFENADTARQVLEVYAKVTGQTFI